MLNKFLYGMLLVIGAAAMIDAYILSFKTSIYNFGTWFPGIVGILLVLISIGKLTGKIEGMLSRYSRLINAVKILLVLWLCSFIIVEGYILFPDTRQKYAEPDYVIILGAGLNGDKLSWLLSERMETALQYLKTNSSKVVVSGGQGPDEDIAEGTAMKNFLVENGIESQRIIVEDKSKSTLENFKFTRDLLPAGQHKILVITSDFHMRRALMLAGRTGFAAEGLTSRTPNSIVLNCYLREYFALLKSLL